MASTQKEQLAAQLNRKQREFDELKQKIDNLMFQEEESSQQIEEL